MIKLEWDQKIKEWKVEDLIVTSIVCDGSAKCSTKWGIVGSGSGDVGWTGKDCGKLYSQDCWKDSLRVRSVCHRWTDPHWQRKKNVAGIYEVSAWSSSAREMTWEWFQKKKKSILKCIPYEKYAQMTDPYGGWSVSRKGLPLWGRWPRGSFCELKRCRVGFTNLEQSVAWHLFVFAIYEF